MRTVIVALTGITFLLGGCSTIKLPNGEKEDRVVVCGATLAESKCAPSDGRTFRLKKQRKTISVDESGQPNYLSYIGTIVRKGNTTGEAGAVCGNTRFGTFKEEQIKPTFGNSIDFSYNLSAKYKGNLESDLINALSTAGVSDNVTDALDADIKLAASKLEKQTLTSEAKFVEYKMSQETLRRLEVIGSDEGLNRCRDELVTGNWNFYQAITGFNVSSAKFESDKTKEIITELKAKAATKARDAQDELNLAAIDVNLDRQTNRILKTVADPYFEVVGVSFWTSPRCGDFSDPSLCPKRGGE